MKRSPFLRALIEQRMDSSYVVTLAYYYSECKTFRSSIIVVIPIGKGHRIAEGNHRYAAENAEVALVVLVDKD